VGQHNSHAAVKLSILFRRRQHALKFEQPEARGNGQKEGPCAGFQEKVGHLGSKIRFPIFLFFFFENQD
jgi:hypothetical protein